MTTPNELELVETAKEGHVDNVVYVVMLKLPEYYNTENYHEMIGAFLDKQTGIDKAKERFNEIGYSGNFEDYLIASEQVIR